MPLNSVGRLDWGVWDPITDRSVKPSGLVRMTLHTAATTSPDIYGPGKGPGETYAHAYNPTNGALRQHQEAHHFAYADLDGNGKTFAMEHQDAGPSHGIPFSENQLDNAARVFADLVIHSRTCPQCNVPNRIATVDDTRGLAWHRLGVPGNFPPYDPHDRKTWCQRDTGERWTTDGNYGKSCPWNERIDQVDEIYSRAQPYINGGAGIDTLDKEDPLMAAKWFNHSRATDQKITPGDWRTIKIKEDDESNTSEIARGAVKVISGKVSLNVKGLDDAGYLDARCYAFDDAEGTKDDKRTSTGTFERFHTPRNGLNVSFPLVWNLGEGKGSKTRRLRLEVRTPSKNAVIDGVRVEGWTVES